MFPAQATRLHQPRYETVQVLVVGQAGDEDDHLVGGEQPVVVEQGLRLPQKKPVSFGRGEQGIVQDRGDGVVKRGEVEPHQPLVRQRGGHRWAVSHRV